MLASNQQIAESKASQNFYKNGGRQPPARQTRHSYSNLIGSQFFSVLLARFKYNPMIQDLTSET